MPETSTAGISPISCSNQALELLTAIPTSVLGAPETGKVSASRCSSTAVARVFDKVVSPRCTNSDAEVTLGLGNRGSGSTSETVVSSAKAMIEAPILNVVPPSLVQYPWVVQNQFSPLSDLGNGVEDVLVERDDHEEVQRSNHGFQTNSRLQLLPWETSEASDHNCGCGEKAFCVLECDPLSRWEPNELSELVLAQESGPPSNWVSQLMKNFCNMVGFPITKHEAQCLALFRLLE